MVRGGPESLCTTSVNVGKTTPSLQASHHTAVQGWWSPCLAPPQAALCSKLEPPHWKELREHQIVGRLSPLLCHPLKGLAVAWSNTKAEDERERAPAPGFSGEWLASLWQLNIATVSEPCQHARSGGRPALQSSTQSMSGE